MVLAFLPKSQKITNWFFIFLLLFLGSCQSETTAIQTKEGRIEISSEELLATLGEAYLFGYPLVLMDLTKQVSTNIEAPHPTLPRAPINQLGHFRTFPDHTMTAVVKPNVDTYYSIAWFDLTKGPQVLSMPATDRYYLLPFLDAYSNVFASPGTRTTGTTAQDFLIVAPDWKGMIPDGMQLIQSPTTMAWMIGRIQVNSKEDGATAVKAIQDQMRLVPLNAFGQTDYSPARGNIDESINETPVKAIQELDIITYFNRMAAMMVKNPPKAADSVIVRKMAKIGLVAGESFELNTDNFILETKLKMLPSFVHKQFEERRAEPDTNLLKNGWVTIYEGIGTYDIDYKRRAYIDFVGLGANIPEDAIYPICVVDAKGHHLDASKKYRMHFDESQLPPVNAFWSLTAYNADDFLIKNDINRFAIGDRDNLKYNADGSLDLYIQNSPPAKENMSNWLPIPQTGRFSLTLRLYHPKSEILKGAWSPPVVEPL